uniref:Uncharacterized protein n=1 Tax=Arundo donax TaxID=35708 RepID=A0A0A9CQ19_ARUDO
MFQNLNCKNVLHHQLVSISAPFLILVIACVHVMSICLETFRKLQPLRLVGGNYKEGKGV